ncbi:MAG TPA: hypothetical protein G4O18_05940 [Dehalococcoidia bacterium]|nr:hypothetical protein [Dehalococcoidia bacterium]
MRYIIRFTVIAVVSMFILAGCTSTPPDNHEQEEEEEEEEEGQPNGEEENGEYTFTPLKLPDFETLFEERRDYLLATSTPFKEALEQSNWYGDGNNLTDEQKGFIIALAPLSFYATRSDSLPELDEIIRNHSDAYVSRQIETDFGDLYISIVYNPELTDRQLAEDILEFQMSYVQFLQAYVGIPFINPKNASPAHRTNYSIFVDVDPERSSDFISRITSSRKHSMVRQGHETTHRYEFGPVSMEEATVEYLPNKFIAIYVSEHPEPEDWFRRLDEAVGGWAYDYGSGAPPEYNLDVGVYTLEKDISWFERGKYHTIRVNGKLQVDTSFDEISDAMDASNCCRVFSYRLMQLEQIMGESAMQSAYRELAEDLELGNRGGYQDIYNIFRNHVPADKADEFNAFFTDHVSASTPDWAAQWEAEHASE